MAIMGFRPFKWAPELICSTSRSREDNVKPFLKNRLEKWKICISIRYAKTADYGGPSTCLICIYENL